MSLWQSVKTVGYGIFIFVFLIVYQLLFLPIRFLLVMGQKTDPQRWLRRLLLRSDERAKRIRDRAAQQFEEGTVRILQFNDLGSLPTSRHYIRYQGLEATERVEKSLENGEFLITACLVILGTIASVIALTRSGQQVIELAVIQIGISQLSWLSVLLSLFGFLILVLLTIRNSITRHLMYDQRALSTGTRTELITKMTWNHLIAENPVYGLKVLYFLYFVEGLGEETFEATTTVLIAAMDPTQSRQEAYREHLPNIVEAVKGDLSSSDMVSE